MRNKLVWVAYVGVEEPTWCACLGMLSLGVEQECDALTQNQEKVIIVVFSPLGLFSGRGSVKVNCLWLALTKVSCCYGTWSPRCCLVRKEQEGLGARREIFQAKLQLPLHSASSRLLYSRVLQLHSLFCMFVFKYLYFTFGLTCTKYDLFLR